MKWEIKPFEALTVTELYQILKLRNEVFVVEQNCVYQDVDGKDYQASHLLGKLKNEIVCYARLFGPGYYFEEASIGRVVISNRHRDKKWGHSLMKEAINGIELLFSATVITISAQLYLQKFYESHSFSTIGDQYLEDDIPHIRMQRKS